MTATIQEHEAHRVQARRSIDRPVPPGPAGNRHGFVLHQPYERQREPAVSYDDRLDDILGETYGTMVYQEQVMLISVEMCGFSRANRTRVSVSPWLRKKIKLLTSTVLHTEGWLGRDHLRPLDERRYQEQLHAQVAQKI